MEIIAALSESCNCFAKARSDLNIVCPFVSCLTAPAYRIVSSELSTYIVWYYH